MSAQTYRLGKQNQIIDLNGASVNFDINFVLNSYFNIQDLKYSTGPTEINLSNIKLNKNFELIDFEEGRIKTFNELFKNNDFSINNSKKIIILGEVLMPNLF